MVLLYAVLLIVQLVRRHMYYRLFFGGLLFPRSMVVVGNSDSSSL